MASTSTVISALTAFYQQVAKHTHVDESALKMPPVAGWGDEIDSKALRELGKTEAVIDFLKHIPYFKGGNVIVVEDGTALDYTRMYGYTMDEVNPIPGHCVYITLGGGICGVNLILDTE